jgi:hypothetical protein
MMFTRRGRLRPGLHHLGLFLRHLVRFLLGKDLTPNERHRRNPNPDDPPVTQFHADLLSKGCSYLPEHEPKTTSS